MTTTEKSALKIVWPLAIVFTLLALATKSQWIGWIAFAFLLAALIGSVETYIRGIVRDENSVQ